MPLENLEINNFKPVGEFTYQIGDKIRLIFSKYQKLCHVFQE